MNLKAKWKMRQVAMSVITTALSASAFVIVLAAIRCRKWAVYWTAIFGRETPMEIVTGGSGNWYFFTHMILPLGPWFLGALLADRFIIGPITEKILE